MRQFASKTPLVLPPLPCITLFLQAAQGLALIPAQLVATITHPLGTQTKALVLQILLLPCAFFPITFGDLPPFPR